MMDKMQTLDLHSPLLLELLWLRLDECDEPDEDDDDEDDEEDDDELDEDDEEDLLRLRFRFPFSRPKKQNKTLKETS